MHAVILFLAGMYLQSNTSYSNVGKNWDLHWKQHHAVHLDIQSLHGLNKSLNFALIFPFLSFLFNVFFWLVLRGHLVFSSPPQQPMTSDFERFLCQILSITLVSYLNSWERASISLFNIECKQGKYWYHFYNVFGMMQSLTGDWTRDLLHVMPALYH